jgi:hypothetical protein
MILKIVETIKIPKPIAILMDKVCNKEELKALVFPWTQYSMDS